MRFQENEHSEQNNHGFSFWSKLGKLSIKNQENNLQEEQRQITQIYLRVLIIFLIIFWFLCLKARELLCAFFCVIDCCCLSFQRLLGSGDQQLQLRMWIFRWAILRILSQELPLAAFHGRCAVWHKFYCTVVDHDRLKLEVAEDSCVIITWYFLLYFGLWWKESQVPDEHLRHGIIFAQNLLFFFEENIVASQQKEKKKLFPSSCQMGNIYVFLRLTKDTRTLQLWKKVDVNFL